MNDKKSPLVTIEDVANMFSLELIREGRNGESQYVCPYCGDKKGHFSINRIKGVCGCFKCGGGGNTLTLYMELSGKAFASNSEAYKDLLKGLGRNDKLPAMRKAEAIEVPENPKADADAIDKAYRAMMSLLTLRPEHVENLHKRGFSDKAIKAFGFKSTPRDGHAIADRLVRRGIDLTGVPGFYTHEDGEWRLNTSCRGFYCPVYDVKRRITGFQIRLDKPNGNSKYLWLSSAGRDKGTSSGAIPTVLKGMDDGLVIVTEGVLKATAVYTFLKGRISVIGVPGVRSLSGLDGAMKAFPKAYAIEAYDMDKAETAGIRALRIRAEAEGADKLAGSASARKDDAYHDLVKQQNIADAGGDLRQKLESAGAGGFHSLTWDVTKDGLWRGNDKGLDDFLNAHPEQREPLIRYLEALKAKDDALRAPVI